MEQIELLKNQNFGIEIELTRITRNVAANVIAKHFGSVAVHVIGSYDTYKVADQSGRIWKVVRDASIKTENKDGNWTSDNRYSVEFVSPICQYSDIELNIQEIVRKLHKAGARANGSCGVHVHVDAANHNATTLKNLVNIITSKEDIIFHMMKVSAERMEKWCKKNEKSFVSEINSKSPKSLDEVKNIWYNGGDGSSQHYHYSRYHGLNLHSVFQKGTVEFRYFNSTTHAGLIKSYIQFCLAVSAQAIIAKKTSAKTLKCENPNKILQHWFYHLDLRGEEFSTIRNFFIKEYNKQ